MRSTYLICYDISNDKRRERVFKACKDHGTHLQFSVFECDLNAMELAVFETRLNDLINHTADQILIVSLSPAENRGSRVIRALGLPYLKMDAPCYIA